MQDAYRRSELETDHEVLLGRLSVVREVIATLRSAEPLKRDAAARLAKYEENERRLSWESHELLRQIEDLVLEESERALVAGDPDRDHGVFARSFSGTT